MRFLEENGIKGREALRERERERSSWGVEKLTQNPSGPKELELESHGSFH